VRRFLDFVGITRPRGSILLPWYVHTAIGAVGVLTAAVFAVARGVGWAAVVLLVLGLVNLAMGHRLRSAKDTART